MMMIFQVLCTNATLLRGCSTNKTSGHTTPYTSGKDGRVERFFRGVKEDCVWQHDIESFIRARVVIRRWIGWCYQGPHLALGYFSSCQYRVQRLQSVV